METLNRDGANYSCLGNILGQKYNKD